MNRSQEKIRQEALLADRERIAKNKSALDALHGKAENADARTAGEIDRLRGRSEYLSPSRESDVYDYDVRIGNKIGDLKIALTKASDPFDYEQCLQLCGAISDLLTDREAAAARSRN
ncbi:MAG: hypothetical protein LBL66_09480 [Clostridiales bacterium]|nr:hypothetical protein [Clostridiales bacterium]